MKKKKYKSKKIHIHLWILDTPCIYCGVQERYCNKCDVMQVRGLNSEKWEVA